MPQVVKPQRVQKLMEALQRVNGEIARWHSSNYKTEGRRDYTPPDLLVSLDVLNSAIEDYFKNFGWSEQR